MKIALVTGANKGIGYEIVKSLCEQKHMHVIVGARNLKLGEAAVATLKKSGRNNVSHQQLDLNDNKSVIAAAEAVQKAYGGLDILINNAGMAWKGNAFNEDVARTTIETNYYGTLRVCNAFFPLLRDNARVVNLSSGVSPSSLRKMSDATRQKFLAPDLSVQRLSELMEEFITDIKNEVSDQKGWPHSTYGVSKVGVTLLKVIQARENKKPGVLINAADPGWCRTDMAGPSASHSAEEGAETPVFLALLPADSTVNGKFYANKREEPLC